MLLSIVAPVFNEEEVLPRFYERLTAVLAPAPMPFEVIFVDDGSTDRSSDVLQRLVRNATNVRVVEFSRNFGHQAAITAGLELAVGDAVITMDSDLQHPPEMIPKLVALWQEGYEVVYTCRVRTEDSGILKRFTSRLFYAAINALGEVNIPPGAADFRLLDRRVVDAINVMGEHSLFLRGLVSWVGFRQIAVPYDAPRRGAGESKYSLSRMLRFAGDGISAFSSVPLYVSVFLGLAVSAVSFLYAAFAIYAKLFTNRVVEGWTSVLVAVLFLGGVQMIVAGIQGAYLGRIFTEVRRRPRYLIRRTYGNGR